MRVAINTHALTTGHKIRGLGFYTLRLTRVLTTQKKVKLIKFTIKPPDNVDLIHYPAFTLFRPYKNIPLKNQTPVVFTVHDLIPLKYPQHFPPGFKGRFKWFKQKITLQKISAIITDSKASKADIVKFADVSSNKVHVIYLAADKIFKPLKTSPDSVKHRYNLPDRFVLYVGDLNWGKNVPLLAQTCLKLNFPLVVVGKQALAKNIPTHPETLSLTAFQKLAKANPKKILTLGFIPTKDLVSIYNLATCYAQPSFAEGFGLPVLEAMASGCPVITSKATSLSEIAGQAALLIKPVQKDLVKALKSCWHQASLRAKLSKLGLIQAQKFSWDKTAQETIKVYEKVIEKN